MTGSGMTVQSSAYKRAGAVTYREQAIVKTRLAFSGKTNAAGEAKKQGRKQCAESTIDDYIARHPDRKSDVDKMVNAGISVRRQNGCDDLDVSEMSMDEYKAHIYALLDTIPFDSSQREDTQFLCITDEGWEQMKKDPKYEAWVLGYFKVDRSVHFPFGMGKRMHAEHFGARIEEHHGESYPESTGSDDDDDKDDWWIKRHKRYKEFMHEAQLAYVRGRQLQRENINAYYRELAAKGDRNVSAEMNQGGFEAAILMSPAALLLMGQTTQAQ